MKQLKEKLDQAVKDVTSSEKIRDHIVITVTGEGLRVEMIEDEAGMFFVSGSPVPTNYGKELLEMLATEIGKLPNKVTMEGHTDSKPFNGRADYSNWELSTDRANAARRLMQEHGMGHDQVTQVRGFADQSLRDPANPESASNRRITLIIQYQRAAPTDTASADKPGEAKTAERKPGGAGAGDPKVAEAKPAAVGSPGAQTKPSPVSASPKK
jgi:chemotaxis protein MotB